MATAAALVLASSATALASSGAAEAITNPAPMPAASYPYMVSVLQLKGGKPTAHMCGGALVSPRFVITAKHCGGKGVEYNIGIVAGSDSPVSSTTIWTAANVFPKDDADVELIELKSAVSWPVVTIDRDKVADGATGTVLGYCGNTDCTADPINHPSSLNSAPVKVQPKPKLVCGGVCTNGESMVLKSPNSTSHAAREGDSGGPFLVNNTLAGIMVQSDLSTTTVALRVSKLTSWIDRITARKDVISIPDAPANFRLGDTGGKLSASWSSPANDGGAPVKGYTLQISNESVDYPPVSLPATATSYVSTYASGGHSYTANLSAYNKKGDSVAALASSSPASSGGSAAYKAAILADHPVAYWPLDDPAGSAAADAAGGPPGQTECGATLGADSGPFAGTTALRLDGGDCSDVNVGADYAALTRVTGALTVEAWARTDTLQSNPPEPYLLVVGQWTNIGYGLEWNGGVLAADFGEGFSGGGCCDVGLGGWHQLAFTYDPATGAYANYVDGRQSYTDNVGTGRVSRFNPAGGALIGRRARSLSNSFAAFSGNVGHISVYDRALTADQLYGHFAAGGTR
jgi:hypothetical protein